MQYASKKLFFDFICQFHIRQDETGNYYNGYLVDERGFFYEKLESLSKNFQQEFVENLLLPNALLYGESLQFELQGILITLTIELKENVLFYRKPLTQEELGEGYDVAFANHEQLQKYKLNRLPEIEEMVRKQINAVEQCQEFIDGNILILKRKLDEKSVVYTDEVITKDTSDDLSVADPNAFFRLRLNKNTVVLFFHLLQKSEYIDNGTNELVSLVERHLAYESAKEKGTFQRITGARQLISQLTKGAKASGPSQETTLKILQEVQEELSDLIQIYQTNKIDPDELKK